MADTSAELARVCAFRDEIGTSGYEADMICKAYDGITDLLLVVLAEVRDLREAVGNA